MTSVDNVTEIEEEEWFEDYFKEGEDFQIDEYNLTATPNDFNLLTIFNFIESGSVIIPGFQRHYIWDIKRASKLIESLILGLPVPQIYLYEESRNVFLVIDGQQRLMSIYYFMKQRFPRKDKRVELREIFSRYGGIPDEILASKEYFSDFKLSLPEMLPEQKNKFNGLTYETLGDYKAQFNLRPIRNVIVKQNMPRDDDSSIYEIFNRLNTGGINLRPQEVRSSLHHSKYYDMLFEISEKQEWRRLLSMRGPDIHGKDIEILLRGFAMLIDGEEYRPSLTNFLNKFSKKTQRHTDEQNEYLKSLLMSFLKACENVPEDIFLNKLNRRFNLALYEAVFAVGCEGKFKNRTLIDKPLLYDKVKLLAKDKEFVRASLEGTTRIANVKIRLDRCRAIVGTL